MVAQSPTTLDEAARTEVLNQLGEGLEQLHVESWRSRLAWRDESSRQIRVRHQHRASSTAWRLLSEWAQSLLQYVAWLVDTGTRVFFSLGSVIFAPFDLVSVFIWAIGGTLGLGFALVADMVLDVPVLRRTSDGLVQYLIAGEKRPGSEFRELYANFPKALRDSAFDAMSASAKDPVSANSSAQRNREVPTSSSKIRFDNTRILDLDVSKLLLALSALMYERDSAKYRAAMEPTSTDTARPLMIKKGAATLAGPPQRSAESLLSECDTGIERIAWQCFGLRYKSVTELKPRHRQSRSNPVAGLFYSPAKPDFIVLAFKGTTPTDFAEWVTNFRYGYEDANEWLGEGYGRVHQGFYSALYPLQGEEGLRGGITPYEHIRRGIVSTGAALRSINGGRPVNVFVTGHSLGSALASMFYARADQRPDDFTTPDTREQVAVVRDLYAYGVPIFGDPHSLGAFNYAINQTAISEGPNRRMAWRINNNRDAVATFLPDLGDTRKLGSKLSVNNQFNFAHVGQQVQINPDRTETGPGTLLVQNTPVRVHSNSHCAIPLHVNATLIRAQKIPLLGRVLSHSPLLYAERLNRVQETPVGASLPWAKQSTWDRLW